MQSKWQWHLLRLWRALSVRAALFAVLGIAASLASLVVEPWLPIDLATKIGADALESILTIIASSMLTVTTFSLGIMVSAYGAASSNVTPRALQILMRDSTTQNSLATFLGAFLYSLVGIIALKTGAYGAEQRLVLYVVTIGVIILIFLTFIRWIETLRRFGRLGDTIRRIEQATAEVLKARLADPYLAANRWDGTPPPDATPVYAETPGYVQHVDMKLLSQAADECELRIYLAAPPGAFVHDSAPLVWAAGSSVAKAAKEAIQRAMTVDETRDFSQDPRFGFIVLAEIASRALSPGINDPGTAIEILGRGVRLFQLWDERAEPKVEWPQLWAPPITTTDLFDDFFPPIARDGATIVEVQIRLQKALLALVKSQPEALGTSALAQSRLALIRAEAALVIEADKFAVRQVAAKVAASAQLAGIAEA